MADDKNNIPTLNEIEKMHIMFVNAKYKPFVECAMDYKHKKLASPADELRAKDMIEKFNDDDMTIGENSLYPIPQFGDFFMELQPDGTKKCVL